MSNTPKIGDEYNSDSFLETRQRFASDAPNFQMKSLYGIPAHPDFDLPATVPYMGLSRDYTPASNRQEVADLLRAFYTEDRMLELIGPEGVKPEDLDPPQSIIDVMNWHRAIALEREGCAKIAEEYDPGECGDLYCGCPEAIAARIRSGE